MADAPRAPRVPPALLAAGFPLCIAGLLVSVMALLPGIDIAFRWPIFFLGAFLYLPGSMIVFFGRQGKERNQAFNAVRLIRMGFLFIALFLMMQTVGTR